MTFFFPDLAGKIDWTAGIEFKDKELEALTTESTTGKRIADMLVQMRSKEGDPLYVLAHTEIQGDQEPDFPLRLYTYNYRIYDRYRIPVVTLAILADARRNWRPTQYKAEIWGKTVTVFNFETVKLLDWEGREAELLEEANPFGIIVATHLAAQKTQKDPTARFDYKATLTRKLYERGLKRDAIINLYRFIELVMTLPADLKIRYNEVIDGIEKERKVQILTSIEERGWQKGIQQGMQQGMQASQAEALAFGERKAKLEDAREMRAAQLDLDLIKRITKLTDEDLAELE